MPGAQAGYEKTMSSLIGTLAGPDLLVGPGSLGGAMVFSLEQVLADVEIFRMCVFAREGIPARGDLWLDDVIERVGPGGDYIAEKSTRVNVRGGQWYLPGLGVHDSRERWTAAGRPGLMEEAGRLADELLATREELPLGDDVERELAALQERARRQDAG